MRLKGTRWYVFAGGMLLVVSPFLPWFNHQGELVALIGPGSRISAASVQALEQLSAFRTLGIVSIVLGLILVLVSQSRIPVRSLRSYAYYGTAALGVACIKIDEIAPGGGTDVPPVGWVLLILGPGLVTGAGEIERIRSRRRGIDAGNE